MLDGGTNSSGYPQDFTFDSVVPQVKVAIEDGLTNLDSDPSSVAANCPTGDCMWQDYFSMGTCSSVDDVTSSIIEHCTSSSDDGDPIDCTYSIPALVQTPPFIGTNLSKGATLFIGASNPVDRSPYPSPNTLVEFYVIYLKNLSIHTAFEPNHTNQLVALKGTLDLCLYKYTTTVTNGTTHTIQVDQLMDLDWQTANLESDRPIVSTTTQGSTDNFSFDHNGLQHFNAYLSLVIFTGEATEDVRHDNSSYTSDTAQTLATALRGVPPDIEGLKGQLENLAISMTNAYPHLNPRFFPTTR